MKTIRYDNTAILTSDDVADAVIEYAAALSGGDRADTVAVPSVAHDGTMTTTKILIGPSSEVVVEDAEEDELEPRERRVRGAAPCRCPDVRTRHRHPRRHPVGPDRW